jgi:hypothetical protein
MRKRSKDCFPITSPPNIPIPTVLTVGCQNTLEIKSVKRLSKLLEVKTEVESQIKSRVFCDVCRAQAVSVDAAHESYTRFISNDNIYPGPCLKQAPYT